MKINYLFYTLIAFLLIGCATPYQPFSTFSRGGYANKKTSLNTYQVEYYGNRLTSKETLNTLLQYRSAELTVQSKYNYYVVIKSQRKVPNSVHGGFIVTKQIIRMINRKPKNKDIEFYDAKEVISQYKKTIADQK